MMNRQIGLLKRIWTTGERANSYWCLQRRG